MILYRFKIFIYFFRIKNTLKIILHKNLMVVLLISIVIYKIPTWIIIDLSRQSQVIFFQNRFSMRS